MTIAGVVEKQNPDGGWPHWRGASWTEPTAYAVLALLAAGEAARARAGIDWLRALRRPDGGWPPCAGIDQSGWATALVALLPPERLGEDAHGGAVRWLLGTTGEESTFLYRLRQFLSGGRTPPDQVSPGWPWTPGAAAWVGPTSVALLALEKERQRNPTAAVQTRIAEGQDFLLNRMCHSGGWNHGSVNALGYPAGPYPETTGMALAGLRGRRAAKVEQSLAVARGFLRDCRSADALNWLRLGLGAHGQLPLDFAPPPEIRFRTVPEMAVDVLVQQGAGEAGLLSKT